MTRSDIQLDDAVEGLALHNEMQPFVQIIEQVLVSLSNRAWLLVVVGTEAQAVIEVETGRE